MTNRIHQSFSGRFKRYVLLLCCVLAVHGCAEKTDNSTQKVNEVIYTLIEADNSSDIETVLAAYTDSVEFYPTGREFIKGIKNVRKNYEVLFKENILSLTTEIHETKIFEGNAIVTGINKGIIKRIADASISKINDKYIAILILDPKGQWKIDKLIWGLNH